MTARADVVIGIEILVGRAKTRSVAARRWWRKHVGPQRSASWPDLREKHHVLAYKLNRPRRTVNIAAFGGFEMTIADPKIELFSTLQTLSDSVPEMRVGQLLAALGELCSDLHGRGLWDATDEELLETVWKFQSDFELNSSS